MSTRRYHCRTEWVFMYASALYCEDCGDKIRAELTAEGKAPSDVDDEGSYDSDDFPKGPFPDGGGEADTPQHCDECHCFLENPLTVEGMAYVKETVERDLAEGRWESVAIADWLPFYDPEISARAIRLGRMNAAMREQADPETGELDTYADGGYPMLYVVNDSEVCCPKCANDHETGLSAFGVEFRDVITAGDANWEDPDLYCDGCSERIPSAYAEDEDAKESEGSP